MAAQEIHKATVRQLFAAINRNDKAAFMVGIHSDFKLEFIGEGKVPAREGHWQMAQKHRSFYSI